MPKVPIIERIVDRLQFITLGITRQIDFAFAPTLDANIVINRIRNLFETRIIQ